MVQRQYSMGIEQSQITRFGNKRSDWIYKTDLVFDCWLFRDGDKLCWEYTGCEDVFESCVWSQCYEHVQQLCMVSFRTKQCRNLKLVHLTRSFKN